MLQVTKWNFDTCDVWLSIKCQLLKSKMAVELSNYLLVLLLFYSIFSGRLRVILQKSGISQMAETEKSRKLGQGSWENCQIDKIDRNDIDQVRATYFGTSCIIFERLTGDGLGDPRGIAVASELGWLFWSDWNKKDPKVERANLDGSERTFIVRDDLGWPNGITLGLFNHQF